MGAEDEDAVLNNSTTTTRTTINYLLNSLNKMTAMIFYIITLCGRFAGAWDQKARDDF